MAVKFTQDAPGYTTVSIYDQTYHLRGQDSDHIRKLADLVDSRMRAVAAQMSSAGAALSCIHTRGLRELVGQIQGGENGDA